MEALIKIGFCKEQTDISRGMHEIAFVAFGLELDNRIYFATNPPIPIESRFLSLKNAFAPFSVIVEGRRNQNSRIANRNYSSGRVARFQNHVC
jgi:hypothetical protein